MKNWDSRYSHNIRSDYVIGEMNITKEPLLLSLSATDICVPINHELTGITKKGMGLLRKLLGEEATEVYKPFL